MNRPKQITTALLLLIVMGIPGLLFVYYQGRQAFIRHEMEEKLERQHLETIRIRTNEVLWYEEGKEIIVQGKLFDVKSQAHEGDEIVFTGLFDEKETLVKKQLEQLPKEKSGEESLTKQFVSLELYHDSRIIFSASHDFLVPQNYKVFNDGRLLLSEHTPPSPPPKG